MARARVPLGLLAAAAMLGAHWLAYYFFAPDGHERAELLRSTGHGYWPVALSLAIVASVIGLGAFITQRMNPALRASRPQVFRHALPRFLALQVGGFVALEVFERLFSGHGVHITDLLATTFLVGVVVQVIVALLGALFLVLVAIVVERVTSGRGDVVGVSLPLVLVSLAWTPRLVPATGAHTLRGPPDSA